ncbi:unnamed protein product [Polarella glacialis]|uniref:Uncharacterized protein n=1 Tax=Polarella glacialis TaxID=89957 RepID=A0A813KRB7_POLGL|nr:unnamed protein product [Polarella glacialis]
MLENGAGSAREKSKSQLLVLSELNHLLVHLFFQDECMRFDIRAGTDLLLQGLLSEPSICFCIISCMEYNNSLSIVKELLDNALPGDWEVNPSRDGCLPFVDTSGGRPKVYVINPETGKRPLTHSDLDRVWYRLGWSMGSTGGFDASNTILLDIKQQDSRFQYNALHLCKWQPEEQEVEEGSMMQILLTYLLKLARTLTCVPEYLQSCPFTCS